MSEHENPDATSEKKHLQELMTEYGALAVRSLSGQRLNQVDSRRFADLMEALSPHIDTEAHYAEIAGAMERSVCHDDCTIDLHEQGFSTDELIELYALKSSGVKLDAWQASRYMDLIEYFLEQGRSVEYILNAAGFTDITP